LGGAGYLASSKTTAESSSSWNGLQNCSLPFLRARGYCSKESTRRQHCAYGLPSATLLSGLLTKMSNQSPSTGNPAFLHMRAFSVYGNLSLSQLVIRRPPTLQKISLTSSC